MADTTSRTRGHLGRSVLVGLLLVVSALAVYAVLLRASQLLRAASVLYSFSLKQPPLSVRAYNRFFGYRTIYNDQTIPGEAGPIAIRVYTPVGRKNPEVLVVVHGFAQDGNRAFLLNDFASALAHQGFRVVLPTLTAESQMAIRHSDLDIVEQSIQWAAKSSGRKVSVIGTSFGGGLTITAAASPGTRQYVKLVLSISGYNDLSMIGKYYSHQQVFDPSGRPYPPSGPKGGAILFIDEYLSEMVPAEDVGPIHGAIQRMIASRRFPILPGDPVLDGLTPRQVGLFIDLEESTKDDVRAHYLGVIERHHAEMVAVSPVSVLHSFDIPLYVMHGTQDRDLPEGEVEWMKTEVADGADVHFLITPWMQHVGIQNAVSLGERIKVGQFLAEVLARAAS